MHVDLALLVFFIQLYTSKCYMSDFIILPVPHCAVPLRVSIIIAVVEKCNMAFAGKVDFSYILGQNVNYRC